jgi:hypothetical protein
VAGEEQGLVGSTHFAEEAKAKKLDIEGMFTNDIVGNDTKTVRVFAESMQSNVGGENDSPSRELARYIVDRAKHFLPDFTVWPIYRRDRFLRNGDHSPFLDAGYPAVRFTEPEENFNHQHQNVRVENGIEYGDLPKFVNFPYVANVARVNAAALASLALAPARPRDVEILTSRLTNDTDLQWAANREPDLDHYEVVWRDTTAFAWQHSRAVGNVTSYTVKGVSKDNYIFGVRAVDKDGHRSPATFPRPKREAPPQRAAGSNAPLREELRAMAKLDQEARNRWLKDQKSESLQAEVTALDEKHVARLREIVKEHGWPGRALVGDNGMSDAWLVAQHGGKEMLHEMLPLMKAAVDKGDLEGSLYATSFDRVRVQDGQPQLYGSQFDTSGDKCQPKPIEDPEHVDERRKAVGLGPLSEYTAQLCAIYKK